jgi:hypothetical protein
MTAHAPAMCSTAQKAWRSESDDAGVGHERSARRGCAGAEVVSGVYVSPRPVQLLGVRVAGLSGGASGAGEGPGVDVEREGGERGFRAQLALRCRRARRGLETPVGVFSVSVSVFLCF